jgi:hypothetical protein
MTDEPDATSDQDPLDDLDDGLLLPTRDPLDEEPDPPTATAVEPRFPDVRAFVTELLALAWGRTVRDTDTDFRWCPHWHEHPTVVERLSALWQAHERARTEGGSAPTKWWREADHTRTQLTAPKGPFARCGPERHQLPTPLPTAEPAEVRAV